uniref:CRM domain-containing protein n=1 Tax=Fagus sylvatica TaxID=28930 RepID=A0A2N9IN60_FAGSY
MGAQEVPLFRNLRRASSLLRFSSLPVRSNFQAQESIFSISKHFLPLNQPSPSWVFRNLSHGSVNLVISQGQPKFETHEVDPPKKYKWLTKKRLKMQRKKEKHKRKMANKRDPRCLRVKGKKKNQRFANPEERIKYKLEKVRVRALLNLLMARSRASSSKASKGKRKDLTWGCTEEGKERKLIVFKEKKKKENRKGGKRAIRIKAKIKEAKLIERLKRYEVPKAQGPVVKPHELTGEERFYMKRMGQKRSNYVPIGRRGVFGGVILNMHMHWKKHETVKVICKPCKPGQVHEYAQEIARLSGGIPIQILGDDTVIFYRGKDYVQPEVMSPIDTLSKKRALEKSKYEQSLESVRHFIAIAEKELELYYRHIALYGDLK